MEIDSFMHPRPQPQWLEPAGRVSGYRVFEFRGRPFEPTYLHRLIWEHNNLCYIMYLRVQIDSQRYKMKKKKKFYLFS